MKITFQEATKKEKLTPDQDLGLLATKTALMGAYQYTQFAKLLLEISDKIVELEITEETPRQAKCMSCNKLHDYQPEKYKKTNGYPGMVTLTPHLETDVVYDGCRGWD